MTEPSMPEFEFHPLAEIFPLLEGEDIHKLAIDIKNNGLIEPITIYEGKILDGRNRYRAAKLAKVVLPPTAFRGMREGMDPTVFVISANIHRRHLTAEQKRKLLAKLIQADPTKSNRQIADQAKVDHKTVGDERKKLEERGEIPHADTRTDTKGRQQKATKKGKKAEVLNTWTRYHAIQEKLIDALTEWPSSSDHALEWANKTRERLDEAIDDWCAREAAEVEVEDEAA